MVEPNEGGQPLDGAQDPNDGQGLGLIDGAGGDLGAGGDENVDQYFDDGGETFLPADHVRDWNCQDFEFS